MHQILIQSRRNIVNHAADANHAVFSGYSAECVDAAAKSLLAGKRLSTLATYEPEATSSGVTPGREGQRRSALGGRRPALRTSPVMGMRPWPAGETPAAIWATLVITREMSS
jgi:hypothetical protein